MISKQPQRLPLPDLGRGVAILGMVAFHFTFDLQMVGLLPAGTIQQPGLRAFAQAVAGSFLFFSGVSLVLAHGNGIRWRPYLRRLAILAGCAALVSTATFVAIPDAFVYFGILHSIATCSLLGLTVLRVPAAGLLGLAALVLALPHVAAHEVFNHPALWWIGLSTVIAPSVDFEPVLPWFAPFLAGMALARGLGRAGLARLLPAAPEPGRARRLLGFMGRHSLAIYLLHQPVLIPIAWGLTFALR